MRIAKRMPGREKRQRAEQQRWWDAHAAARRRRTVEHKHRWVEIAGEGSWTGYGCLCGMAKEVDHQDGSEEVRPSVDPDLRRVIMAAKCDIHPDAFGEGGCDDKREPGTRFCKVHLAQVLKAGLAGK